MEEMPVHVDAADTGEAREKTLDRAALLLEVAASCPHKYTRNGLVHNAQTAFQSKPLVTNLLKLGIFSMNIPTMSGLDEATEKVGVSFATVPSALLATGVHYAIAVAPRAEGPEDEETPIICLDALEAHVMRIEKELSEIHIDHDLVAHIRVLAQRKLESLEPGVVAELGERA